MSKEVLIDRNDSEYKNKLLETYLDYNFSEKDQKLFFDYKKYFLLQKFDVGKIEDEEILNDIIKQKKNRPYLDWKSFMKACQLNYAIPSMYNTVFHKLKLYDFPIYSQIYQIKVCMDVLLRKTIDEYVGNKYKYILSPAFYFYALNYISCKKDCKKAIEGYSKLSIYSIYNYLVNKEVTKEQCLEYIRRLLNKEIKENKEDYEIKVTLCDGTDNDNKDNISKKKDEKEEENKDN